METQLDPTELQAEHDEWQSKINSYKQELNDMNKKLESLVAKDSSTEHMIKVEHFQNQFIRQREVLDIMRHDFKQHENSIEAAHGKENGALGEDHDKHRESLGTFEQIFSDLRKEFTGFSAPFKG